MIDVTKMQEPLYYLDNKSIIFLLPSSLKFKKNLKKYNVESNMQKMNRMGLNNNHLEVGF